MTTDELKSWAEVYVKTPDLSISLDYLPDIAAAVLALIAERDEALKQNAQFTGIAARLTDLRVAAGAEAKALRRAIREAAILRQGTGDIEKVPCWCGGRSYGVHIPECQAVRAALAAGRKP